MLVPDPQPLLLTIAAWAKILCKHLAQAALVRTTTQESGTNGTRSGTSGASRFKVGVRLNRERA